MSKTSALVVFTTESIEHILSLGGTASWRLARQNARQCKYAVCTRNAYHPEDEGSEPHRSAFLIGRISDVVQSPESGYQDRFLIQFREFARVNIPNVWKGDRNPVKYTTMEELGIDPDSLTWETMPPRTVDIQAALEPSTRETDSSPLTIAEAKKALARTFGVSPDAIEITIRG